MAKGTDYLTQWLALVFNNTPLGTISDAGGLTGGGVAGNLYLALHTADPSGAGHDQTTNEISYTGYARAAAPRSPAGFIVAGNTVALTNTVTFGGMAGGVGGTVTHFSIGVSPSGAGAVLYSGPVSPNIPVTLSTYPGLTPTVIITES